MAAPEYPHVAVKIETRRTLLSNSWLHGYLFKGLVN